MYPHLTASNRTPCQQTEWSSLWRVLSSFFLPLLKTNKKKRVNHILAHNTLPPHQFQNVLVRAALWYLTALEIK